MDLDIISALCTAMQADCLATLRDEPLSRHTTFRIGGAARILCIPHTPLQLARALQLCREYGVRTYLLGNGSNTLFSDNGFDGAVIKLSDVKTPMLFTANDGAVTVHAGAGEMLSAVCTAAKEHGCTGLEFAYGIPGTLGGAVYMNAGAYGGEMKDVLVRVSYIDENLKLCTKDAQELALGYRSSIFEKKPWCITEAVLRLERGDPEKITARMQELMQRRRDKQPLDMPSAGSTFKRPEGAFAGKLIEDCGLRGYSVGGAQISEKHCGFVVNTGGATCADVVALTEQVKSIVYEKTGKLLEREIRVVE